MWKKKKDADYYERKIRRIESKIKALPEGAMEPISSDEESTYRSPSHQQTPSSSWMVDGGEPSSDLEYEVESNHQIDGEQLPEEFLLALGTEGAEKEEFGKSIRPELAIQWRKIMTEGLSEEAKTNIINKYPTPSNFHNDIAPVMNPEILATLAIKAVNRDKRIVTRQNLTGKLLTCLGRSLTNILNGNIDSKTLIEEINDAAKLAAEIHHGDSSSRKFFALSGANKTICEVGKHSKTDIFLFGTDFANNIKIAESITTSKSSSTEIAESTKMNMQFTATTVKQKWTGKPQNQQSQFQQPQFQQPQYYQPQFQQPRYQQPRYQKPQHQAYGVKRFQQHPQNTDPRFNRPRQSEWRRFPNRSRASARSRSPPRSRSSSRSQSGHYY